MSFSEEKREELSAVMSEASDWIWDVEEPTAIVYQDKLAELKKATKEWRKRVEEYQKRPEIIENLQVIMSRFNVDRNPPLALGSVLYFPSETHLCFENIDI